MINNYFDEVEYHSLNSVYTHHTYRTSLYIGDASAALDIDTLIKNNIKTVITAAASMDHISYQPYTQIKHLVYPLLDIKSENISKLFNPIYELIEKQLENNNVLVHCAAGISRSATLVIAYLMRHNNWTFKQAIAFVRNSRPAVCPNLGFERQLKQYEQFLHRQNREYLQRKGPRTSEQSKHLIPKNKNYGLPQIVSLGRTQLRGVMLDPFPLKQIKTSHRARPSQTDRNYPEKEESPLKLKPLKTKRTKSLMDRQQKRQDPLGLGPISAQSVLVRRLNIIQSLPSERLASKRPRFVLGLLE